MNASTVGTLTFYLITIAMYYYICTYGFTKFMKLAEEKEEFTELPVAEPKVKPERIPCDVQWHPRRYMWQMSVPTKNTLWDLRPVARYTPLTPDAGIFYQPNYTGNYTDTRVCPLPNKKETATNASNTKTA